ncbi:MAG: TonB C-terminal domain-containing protein [Paraburkholderia sp.]|nr:TonB C-terminal domain-containing protein [Paraburkholderia sp.]
MGIPPDSPRAAQIKRWGERMKNDPDVSHFLGNGPNHANVFSLSPQVRAEFFAEAALRLSPEERSKLLEFTSEAFDNAPSDCGGVKNPALVVSRYLPLGTMSDADVDSYFGITISMFKQSALQTPFARVTEEQRAQAMQGVMKTLIAMLRNDAEGTRDVAAAVADPAGVSAEAWCKSVRLYNRALLATPQPLRDWSLVAADTDGIARLASLSQSETLGAGVPEATPAQDYASRVSRRVRPNIVWAGPALELETAITVRCEPGGTIVSATITRSSGNAAWDTAALRAVLRSDPMPSDANGRTPREFVIDLRPAG